jgi:hypothetical protein
MLNKEKNFFKEENFFEAIGNITQKLNLYAGGDFVIYTFSNHRRSEKIHLFSQEKLKKDSLKKLVCDILRSSKIENFEFLTDFTDLIHMKVENFSIYFIYYPYRIYKEIDIVEIKDKKLKTGIKSFSVEDSICVKINVFVNSQDKREIIESALDILFGIEKANLPKDELAKIYEYKYSITFYEIINDIKEKIKEISENEITFENLGIEPIQKITKKELTYSLQRYFT